ncbi:TPA: VirB4-like conjugal transfer ATPase, CD1110 family [Streptococcus suis]
MISFNQRPSRKLSKTEKQRRARLRRTIKPSSQNTIRYTSLFEEGLMHITSNNYSKTWRLGDVAYNSTTDEEKIDVIDTYAEAINSLDAGDYFQFLGINRRVERHVVTDVLFEEKGDQYQVYRDEYNEIVRRRFSKNSRNFQFDKYITVTTEADDVDQAGNQLDEIGTSLANQFAEMEINLTDLEGLERLKIFSLLLRGENYLTYDYRDIDLAGLTTKDFIAPNRIKFMEDKMKLDQHYAKVMYVRKYPSFLSDKLIKKLTETGIEFAITIHAKPYEESEAIKKINASQANVKAEIIKNQRDGLRDGVIDPDLATSGLAREINEATKSWKKELIDNDQKMYSGLIAIYYMAPDMDTLDIYTDKIRTAARRLGVDFEDCYYHQEEALNTILPIGLPYLEVKRRFMRDMTTANLATQIPWTNVELISQSHRALYYGQNQLSNNIITLDRKADLNTGSGMIFGTSGSGKGMAVKTTEIIPTLLKFPEDRIIIIDPEDEVRQEVVL